jgi:hypothetical protein
VNLCSNTHAIAPFQAATEALSLLSFGSRTLHRRFAYHARVLFDLACGGGGSVALLIYDQFSPTGAFWLSGTACALFAAAYVGFMVPRFGCSGGDAHARGKARLLAAVAARRAAERVTAKTAGLLAGGSRPSISSSAEGAVLPPLARLPSSGDSSEALAPHRSQHVALTIGTASGLTLECAVCLSPFATVVADALGDARSEALTVSKTAIALRCGHRFCVTCLARCASAGLAACPVCRLPHELDTHVLSARSEAFRAGNRSWRSGAAVGAKGEVDDVSASAHFTPSRSSGAVESVPDPEAIVQ